MSNSRVHTQIKMKWLRNQVREKIKYEAKLRRDIRDALTSNEGDRKFLLQELAKREEVLDELAQAKQGGWGLMIIWPLLCSWQAVELETFICNVIQSVIVLVSKYCKHPRTLSLSLSKSMNLLVKVTQIVPCCT